MGSTILACVGLLDKIKKNYALIMATIDLKRRAMASTALVPMAKKARTDVVTYDENGQLLLGVGLRLFV